MLNALLDLVEIFENIPQYFMFALESVINVFFLAIQGLLELAALALGELPELENAPSFVGEMNWYYPVGPLVTILASFLTLYIAWLGISWIYRKFGSM